MDTKRVTIIPPSNAGHLTGNAATRQRRLRGFIAMKTVLSNPAKNKTEATATSY